MRPTPLAPPDSGQLCYRQPGEPRDERPTLMIRRVWDSVEEEAAYLSAAHNNPRVVDVEADEIESPMAYIKRLAEIVQRGPLPKVAKPFPRKPWTNREYSGPRPVVEGGLSFEDRLDVIYEREPGQEG